MVLCYVTVLFDVQWYDSFRGVLLVPSATCCILTLTLISFICRLKSHLYYGLWHLWWFIAKMCESVPLSLYGNVLQLSGTWCSDVLCCVAAVLCQPGRYLLNGVCYTDCPLTYYPTNITSVSLTDRGQPVAVTGICSRCNSVGVCTDLLRLLLTVVGIVASIAITVVVFACLRGVCRRPATNRSIGGIAAARLHSARYITNGHIIAGLSTRPLLAASDTDSSDESETPCDSAIVNNI